MEKCVIIHKEYVGKVKVNKVKLTTQRRGILTPTFQLALWVLWIGDSLVLFLPTYMWCVWAFLCCLVYCVFSVLMVEVGHYWLF